MNNEEKIIKFYFMGWFCLMALVIVLTFLEKALK